MFACVHVCMFANFRVVFGLHICVCIVRASLRVCGCSCVRACFDLARSDRNGCRPLRLRKGRQ